MSELFMKTLKLGRRERSVIRRILSHRIGGYWIATRVPGNRIWQPALEYPPHFEAGPLPVESKELLQNMMRDYRRDNPGREFALKWMTVKQYEDFSA
jgi:hypothetical protein